MIVKIQRLLFTTREGTPHVLVYTRDRKTFVELPLTKDIEEVFGDRLKLYFRARMVGTVLELDEEVERRW